MKVDLFNLQKEVGQRMKGINENLDAPIVLATLLNLQRRGE